MGFLNLFAKANATVNRLPAGSMTVARDGRILATTISSVYPPELLREVGDEVRRLFSEARAAQVPVSELQIQFASLQITAREMRGGALVILTPRLFTH